MFEKPPQEKQFVSWLYVVIWSLIIFITIPLARDIQRFVAQNWGRELFTYVVISSVVVLLITGTFYIIRHRLSSRVGSLWLLAVAAIFIGYTIELGKMSPEESLHFIQYGVLGFLVYRALTHKLQDSSVYFAAATICAMVGTLDEFIQWITPERYWGLKDVWINFFGASLVQIAIAMGLKPKFIWNRPSRANLRFLLRLTIAALVMLWASLMNTPSRIGWYAERIPFLAFLKYNATVMLEYGYLYDDRATGIFRSRFSPDELKSADQKRGKEVAAILDSYREWETYTEFLKIYTPMNDPFAHEARVHLASRDIHFVKAVKHKDNPDKYIRHLNVAFRENQIMEKYFSQTLHHSSWVWPADKLAIAKEHLLMDWTRESRVSKALVTKVRESQVAVFFMILILGLILSNWHLGRQESSRS
jgi:hypothetical protein